MTKKHFDSESDDKCPKCGVKQWWLLDDNALIPIKGNKVLLILSYCKNCGSYFKREKKLIPLTASGKMLNTAPKKLTAWQLFSRDCMAHGKSLKEASHLWWHEWQTYTRFPKSLADLTVEKQVTSSSETGEGKQQ